MVSSDEVRVRINDLRTAADNLNNTADSIDSAVSTTNEIIGSLMARGFVSPAATAFHTRFLKNTTWMDEWPIEVREFAERLTEAAEEIENAVGSDLDVGGTTGDSSHQDSSGTSSGTSGDGGALPPMPPIPQGASSGSSSYGSYSGTSSHTGTSSQRNSSSSSSGSRQRTASSSDSVAEDADIAQLFLAEGLTSSEALEGVAIVDRMDKVGFDLGISPYNGAAWTLEELRTINDSITQITNIAAAEFVSLYSQEELIRLAYAIGLPPERANDAVLMLLTGNRTRTLLLDGGYNGGDSVAYLGPPENYGIRRSVTLTDGEYSVTVQYDSRNYTIISDSPVGPPFVQDGAIAPEFQLQADQNSRTVVFYGRASSNGIILSDYIFEAVDNNFSSEYGNFTREGLIIHEFSHLIDNNVPIDAQAALGTETADLIQAPRSANTDFEIRADILTNGFMGNLSEGRQANFNTFLSQSFAENYNPNDFQGIGVPEDYLNQVPGYNPAAET